MRRIFVITGMSGAGKSTAVRLLEDSGFFCIDNIPPKILKELITILTTASIKKMAFVVDVRSAKLGDSVQAVKELKRAYGNDATILFLEASHDELLRRFASTRRKHPLEDILPLERAIVREQELLYEMRESADTIVDTTGLDIHTLRVRINSLLVGEEHQFTVRVLSFGYKYGVPHDVDFVIDTRFLPNPFYIPELSSLDGRDKKIAEFLESKTAFKEFFEATIRMLEIAAASYSNEGRPIFSIAVGCTGGKHRSVYLAEKLGSKLRKSFRTEVTHRDVDK